MPSQLWRTKSIDKLIADSEDPAHKLKKTLGPWSLVALGIGAIVGSGIFVLTGTAAAGEHYAVPSILHAQVLDVFTSLIHYGNLSHAMLHGRPAAGPSIALSFILVAVACSFAGLCYAELASMIPIAGSAYTYSYATLGELIAWIIGWDLILEYAVSNVAVAVGFSGYLTSLLGAMGLQLPPKLSEPIWQNGVRTGAWFNLPGFLVVMLLTMLLVRGIRESAETNNIMVIIKIAAILIFIAAGGMMVNPKNWHPFAPHGLTGIVTGGAIVFFTYIGFDSVSTASEEAINPQRDIPFGIIGSLIVCAVLYVGVAVVLLGMMKYNTFLNGAASDAPVSYALRYLHANPFVLYAVDIGALMGMLSSLLVFQYGQTRIWFAMSRDRLLPPVFSKVHPRYQTPYLSSWIAGLAVGIPAGLVDIGAAADLSNIGTLFAFVLVAIGVLVLRRKQPDRPRGFRVPFVPLFPILAIVFCGGLMFALPIETWVRFIGWMIIGLIVYRFYGSRRSEFHVARKGGQSLSAGS
ncbi:MAG: amino acid permease [Terriglobales bacterium]